MQRHSASLSEFEARLAEIPGNKELYLHCATGSWPKITWSFLKQHRGRVRYLHAKVTCKKGNCRISP